MALNFPGPYELRLNYTTVHTGVTLEHTQRLNVDLTADPTPVDAFNNINAKTRGGIVTPDLAAAVEAWLALIAPRFHTSSAFGIVELWKYVPLTFDAQFISSYNPTVVAGTDTNPTVATQQETLTFRTLEGGILRIQLMESVANTNQREPYPTGDVDIDPIFVFVFGTSNWILGRDTSYPFSAINHLGGQNEKLFRARFR
jgi:hypothetical protein